MYHSRHVYPAPPFPSVNPHDDPLSTLLSFFHSGVIIFSLPHLHAVCIMIQMIYTLGSCLSGGRCDGFQQYSTRSSVFHAKNWCCCRTPSKRPSLGVLVASAARRVGGPHHTVLSLLTIRSEKPDPLSPSIVSVYCIIFSW